MAGRIHFNSLPIRLKLLFIIVSMGSSALLIAALLQTVLDWSGERQTALVRLEINARMLAIQSRAALEFVDSKAANENLAALQVNQPIRRACIYNEAGEIFAAYSASMEKINGKICPSLHMTGVASHWDRLEGYYDIMHDDRRLGTIYLERSLNDVYQRLAEQMAYQLGIILMVIILMWWGSFYFQRTISEPIVRLAENTWLFSLDRSHPLEVIKQSDDEIGKLVDAFSVMMDEIRRNERQLGQAIAELTRSNTELERFAHICSHDLQEPLRMVSSYAALLEKQCKDQLNPEALEYLEFITDGAERMRDLIKDILEYARIGHQAEPMQRLDLNQLANYVLQNLSATIKECEAVVHKADLPEIMGNKTLLLQIFQNLLSNAVKFCRTAPEIWIDVKRREDGWEFSVKDNGIGIDPKYHDKIFEIFKRLNRREEFRGTGIGLAIFKKAVEYHGGRTWVESQLDKGTTFFFTIPDQGFKEQ